MNVRPRGENFREVVASAEIGEELFFSREDLNVVIENPEHTAQELLALFREDFGEVFEKGIGVWEGYSLGRHTKMVLEQYRKYFSKKPLPEGVSQILFETLLVLHDIGKPKAVELGKKEQQHLHTKLIQEHVLVKLGFTDSEISIALSLQGDPVGSYVRYGNVELAVKEIVDMAQEAGMPLPDYWDLLKVYYMVDAGSYTEDAGGYQALDFLFVFDHEKKEMSFSSDAAKRIEALEQALFSTK